MQRMYAPGYSIGERKEWRAIIHENIETAVNSLMLLLDNDSVRIHLVSEASLVDVLAFCCF
jgi:hypothetical protein